MEGQMAAADTRARVRQRVIELLGEVAHIPAERVRDEATIDEDLRMESVAFVELQVALEDEYGIELDPIEIVERNRFGAIVDYIASMVDAAQ